MGTLSHCTVDEEHKLLSNALNLTLKLLAQRVLFYEDSRRLILNIMSHLLEKLDAHNMDVHETIVKIAGVWLARPLIKKGKLHPTLSLEERVHLISKLEGLQNYSGIPGSLSIFTSYM